MKTKNGSLSLVLMFVITLVTQVLTLMKSSVVAGIFGAGNEMDAYSLANSIVSFLFGFISAGVSTIIIPEYSNKRNRKAVDAFITLIYIILFAVIGLMILLRCHLIDALSNRDDIFVYMAANIFTVVLLTQVLTSVSNITVAYFQCEGYYNMPKIIALVSQLAVVGILLWVDTLTIMEYVYILSAGVVFNFALDTAVAVKKGWRFRPTFKISDETKLLMKRFFPVIFSTGVYNLSLMIDSTIAALLETGQITILNYSSQISAMVNTVIVGNLLIYIYPKITKNIKNDNFQPIFWRQTQLFHAIVCLMIAGFAAIGKDAVLLLFGHGEFTKAACETVFYGAAVYILGQQTNVLRNMVYRYFYAVGDTKTPAGNSVIVSVANITISLILVRFFGLYGIILGTILSSLISLTIIMVQFGKKIGYEKKPLHIIARYLLNLAVTAVTIAAVFATQRLLVIDNMFLRMAIFGMETVVIFAALQWLTNRKVIMAYKTL